MANGHDNLEQHIGNAPAASGIHGKAMEEIQSSGHSYASYSLDKAIGNAMGSMGLGNPSESMMLTFGDLEWGNGQIRYEGPKTFNHNQISNNLNAELRAMSEKAAYEKAHELKK